MNLREFLIKKSVRAKEINDFSNLPVYGVSNVDGICVTGNNPGEKKDEYILIEENDFAYNPYRVNVGSIGLAPKGMRGLVSPAYVVFQTNDNLLPELLWSFIKSKEGLTQIISHARGTVRKTLRFEDLCKLDMYIPPKNEQKKILLKLQDQNSKIQNLKSETTHQLDLLKKLKQQILQDAVQGKLVKQDPNDEPATVLLEKIKTEKEKLFKEKKLKPGKPLPPLKEDEIPFQIPENWVWCRLGEIIVLSDNLNIHSKMSEDTIINYIDIDAIDNKKFTVREVKEKKVSELSSRARRVLKKDYFLYSLVRPYLNNLAIIEEEKENLIGSTGFAAFKCLLVEKYFIKHLLLSDYINKLYLKFMSGFNSPGISHEQFQSTIIPLPPLSEQKRIVSKVDGLMKKINELEVSIKHGQEYTELLMQSVLQDALNPGGRKSE